MKRYYLRRFARNASATGMWEYLTLTAGGEYVEMPNCRDLTWTWNEALQHDPEFRYERELSQ